MGELINLNPKSTIVDSDIPDTIARDTETTSAIQAHTALADPHPSLWTRIANAFLARTGGMILKNNPAINNFSYSSPNNSIEIQTNNGTNPIIGFHRAGFTATALYHLGNGNNSLRIRNDDGFDSALLHDGNIGVRHAVVVATMPSTLLAMGAGIPLPAQILGDKVVSLDAIAKVNAGSWFLYIPPWGLAWTQGYKYSVNVSGNNIVLGTGGSNESLNILGSEVRIVVGYLP